LFGEPGLHPAAGLKPERRAAPGAAASICSTLLGGEQRALAGTGPAAAHIDRRHCRPVENYSRDAGRQRGVIGVTDADAREYR
jgi:hypothetical protein